MSKIDKDALIALNARANEIETVPDTNEPLDEKKYNEFIGFNVESRIKSQLALQASLDGVGLSQWIREVLQMELLRITKGEASSREMLIRERRIRAIEGMTG
tara:strand:- start:1261 stop:1566 length:306 start_codon:yes stop_codon:yes gene_type:complete